MVYTIKTYVPPRTTPVQVIDFCSPKHRREWERWEWDTTTLYLACDERNATTRECLWCGSLVHPV